MRQRTDQEIVWRKASNSSDAQLDWKAFAAQAWTDGLACPELSNDTPLPS